MNNSETPLKKTSRTTLLLTFIIIMFSLTLLLANNHTILLTTTAQDTSNIIWNENITISESKNGLMRTLTIGEAQNASNGEDYYDRPAPPTPPVNPNINAWLETTLETPFNQLIIEYRPPSIETQIWDIYIMWEAEQNNKTFLELSWNTAELDQSDYSTITLYKDDELLIDMLTKNSYTFETESMNPNHFQIRCSQALTTTQDAPLSIPLLLLITFIIILAIISTIVVSKKRKK